jgi:arabinose-5-phosphate isomerase
MTQEETTLLATAHLVLADEMRSLQNLNGILGAEFERACRLILDCTGRVIFTGVGHSGHVGNKSAANMSSLCKPAYFLHAGEAAHGDLGLVMKDDLVILISNSGETAEVLTIIPQLHQLGVKMIAIVGNTTSSLAKACDVVLPIGAEDEAGPFKFAGSSSALNTMALCDALIIAIAAAKGLREEDYLKAHPGGAIGKQLKEKLSKK